MKMSDIVTHKNFKTFTMATVVIQLDKLLHFKILIIPPGPKLNCVKHEARALCTVIGT